MMDKDEKGARFLVQEIDPFTFLGVFNRGIRKEQRLAIRPDTFLNLDSINRRFLKIKLPTAGLNSEFYITNAVVEHLMAHALRAKLWLAH